MNAYLKKSKDDGKWAFMMTRGFVKKYLIVLLLLGTGCTVNRLPEERLNQFSLSVNYDFYEDHLSVELENPLHCPIRIWIISDDPSLANFLDEVNPLLLDAKTDSTITISISRPVSEQLRFTAKLGDPSREITATKINLPFQPNESFNLIQGADSEPTHNTAGSRYALDFGLKIGDTVCAATDGFVVGMIEGYKSGGQGPEWRDYGNFITIYDPQTGLFTQYVHLMYEGSIVNVGDAVFAGQAIGLSGMTGQTNIEHLHFNCLAPDRSKNGMKSIPIDSIGPYKFSELKRNEPVTNN